MLSLSSIISFSGAHELYLDNISETWHWIGYFDSFQTIQRLLALGAGVADSPFTVSSLAIYSSSFLLMFILAYGIATPGGIFMPSIMVSTSFLQFIRICIAVICNSYSGLLPACLKLGLVVCRHEVANTCLLIGSSHWILAFSWICLTLIAVRLVHLLEHVWGAFLSFSFRSKRLISIFSEDFVNQNVVSPFCVIIIQKFEDLKLIN